MYPVGVRNAGPARSHRVAEDKVHHFRQRQAIRQQDTAYDAALRIANAMSLAGLFGYSLSHWPVAWWRGWCVIFHPPPCGAVCDAYVGSNLLTDGLKITRADGIALLAPRWNQSIHVGDVPADSEVQKAWSNGLCFNKALPSLPLFKVAYHHGDDDKDSEVHGAILEERGSAPDALTEGLRRRRRHDSSK